MFYKNWYKKGGKTNQFKQLNRNFLYGCKKCCSENVALVALNQQFVRLSCKDSDSVVDLVGSGLFQCVV